MRFQSSLAILVILLLSACATGPTRQFVKTGLGYDARIPSVKRIAIITDVCLQRDVLTGDRYWSIKDSRAAEQYMTESAKTYMISKGYEVVFLEAPLVGAFKNQNESFKFALEEGGEVREMHPPLFVAEGLATEQAYRQSLMTIVPGILKTVDQISKPSSAFCCTAVDMKQALDVISKRTGGDAILFLIGNGIIVPTGKSVTEGIVTGAITTALTLGMFTYSQWSVSYLDTHAALVDANTGEVLWSNSLRLKGGGFTEKDYYAEKWPKNILYHMPSKVAEKAK
ncbi:MAG: hypothetical protein U1F76_17595 [Candidatus Competibacteraceae bacterium]